MWFMGECAPNSLDFCFSALQKLHPNRHSVGSRWSNVAISFANKKMKFTSFLFHFPIRAIVCKSFANRCEAKYNSDKTIDKMRRVENAQTELKIDEWMKRSPAAFCTHKNIHWLRLSNERVCISSYSKYSVHFTFRILSCGRQTHIIVN